ncbi:hypothetical protein [Paenibacillus rigui]|uniref:Uncharacterized protein n=1 Tax=Paenibacillus rigui TaxID=554312 RepID=A0A229UQD6_9BACL|nr:hypothetical protein [Paenibacillus rigui]OXM85089.1 hypothetical protein CF651_15875 [Paenibacillus rigui]
MLTLITVAALLIISMETPSLIRQRKWKELAMFSGFLVSGLVLGVLLVLQFAYSEPGKSLEAVFKPVSQLLIQ